jgi:hypothetical protein
MRGCSSIVPGDRAYIALQVVHKPAVPRTGGGPRHVRLTADTVPAHALTAAVSRMHAWSLVRPKLLFDKINSDGKWRAAFPGALRCVRGGETIKIFRLHARFRIWSRSTTVRKEMFNNALSSPIDLFARIRSLQAVPGEFANAAVADEALYFTLRAVSA